MSLPIYSTTSPVIGQIQYGWIGESWRLFSSQMGIWISATLLLFAPSFLFVIAFYAMLWPTLFPNGFAGAPPPPPPAGSNPFLFHVTPMPSSGVGGTAEILALEIGFGLVYSLWSAYLYGGLFRIAVRQVRGLPIEMRDIFRGGRLFGRMLGAIYLLGLSGYFLETLCLGPAALLAWRHGPALALAVAGVVGVVLLICLSLALTGTLLPLFALMADGDGVLTAIKRSVRAMKSCRLAAAGFVFVLGILVYASEIPCGLGLLATIPMIFLVTALVFRDKVGMPDMAPPPAPFYPPAAAGTWPPPPTYFPPANLPTEGD